MNPENDVVHDAFTPCIRVDVARQVMETTLPCGEKRTYPISTSRFGLGSEPGSYKTPLGRFRVAEKHGQGAPLWAEFKSRLFTGEISEPGGDEDKVLSRILWLDGLDPENANSKDRYIYIHGTNQEHLLGTAASHGCVRMRNDDIAELFENVPVNTLVEIA